MRKNYSLLRKLACERANPIYDDNVYFFISKGQPRLEVASVVVDREVYVCNPKDVNRINWQLSE